LLLTVVTFPTFYANRQKKKKRTLLTLRRLRGCCRLGCRTQSRKQIPSRAQGTAQAQTHPANVVGTPMQGWQGLRSCMQKKACCECLCCVNDSVQFTHTAIHMRAHLPCCGFLQNLCLLISCTHHFGTERHLPSRKLHMCAQEVEIREVKSERQWSAYSRGGRQSQQEQTELAYS